MPRSTSVLIVAGTDRVALDVASAVVAADKHLFVSGDDRHHGVQRTVVCAAVFGDADQQITLLRGGQHLSEATDAVLLVVWIVAPGHCAPHVLEAAVRQLTPTNAPPEVHTMVVPLPPSDPQGVAATTGANAMTLVANVRRQLFAFAASQYIVDHPAMSMEAAPLSSCPWYITSGNVRRHPSSVVCSDDAAASSSSENDEGAIDACDTTVLIVDPQAVGHEGDLVLGLVYPPNWRQTKPTSTTCNGRGPSADAPPPSATSIHVVDGCAGDDMYLDEPFVVLVPLGNRESSTHVSGSVPPEGVQRGRDVLHWIGGESGLVGVLSCEGAQGNRLAETSVEFNLQGVVRCVRSSALVASASFHQAQEAEAEAQRRHSLSQDDQEVAEVASPGASPMAPASPVASCATTVNLLRLARSPMATALTTPIVCVAGTSAEAGKTTLAAKLIAILTGSKHNLRVGAVKATGTGGVPDCRAYKRMGAAVAFDQVDAGLPTTYTNPSRVQAYLGRSFLLCQDAAVDVIVVELGGDIIWANNPTLLAMPLFCDNVHRLFVICNDTMAAIGVQHWFAGSVALYHPARSGHRGGSSARNSSSAAVGGGDAPGSDGRVLAPQPRIPAEKVVLVASPFRNSLGAVQRAQAIGGMAIPMDPNDCEAMAAHLADIKTKKSVE